MRSPAVSCRMLTLGWYGWQSCTKSGTRALNLFCLASISCGGLDLVGRQIIYSSHQPLDGLNSKATNFTRPLLPGDKRTLKSRVQVKCASCVHLTFSLSWIFVFIFFSLSCSDEHGKNPFFHDLCVQRYNLADPYKKNY